MTILLPFPERLTKEELVTQIINFVKEAEGGYIFFSQYNKLLRLKNKNKDILLRIYNAYFQDKTLCSNLLMQNAKYDIIL